MFDQLSQKLNSVFDRLKGRGALSDGDVVEALREVRVALLEADVALPVVKDFIAKIKDAAVGQEVMRSITPGQQVVKIVHDHLVDLLGRESAPLNLNVAPPCVIMMLGLQGSGKTTSAGKLARRLMEVEKKRVLLVSLDIYRPAAQEQLSILAGQVGAKALDIVAGQKPAEIARRGLDVARTESFDIVIFDTAGRLTLDDAMMAEASAIRDIIRPQEILLTVDAMIGQSAVEIAREFDEKVGVTGIILTRIDGDARGGAALSMRAVTQKPIKFLGVGEKLDAFEVYHPDRLAGRILGMGDVLSLVEKAAATIKQEEAEAMTEKFLSGGSFDLNDLAKQMAQMRRMGGLGGLMSFLPGMGKAMEAMKNANIDDKLIKRQEAIIGSMTPDERADADIIAASRKRRIAAGAGVQVADVNRLLKQFLEMQKMMRQVSKLGKTGFMRAMMPKFGHIGRMKEGMSNLSTNQKGE